VKFFIAGIMQGSRRDNGVDDQGYRQRIAEAIHRRMPAADILDPWALHPDSPTYDNERGKQVYLSLNEEAAKADVLIAYVPQASMGTAIEIWQAYQAGACILTISPLSENWVVKFLSNRVFATLDEFVQFVENGDLARTIERRSNV